MRLGLELELSCSSKKQARPYSNLLLVVASNTGADTEHETQRESMLEARARSETPVPSPRVVPRSTRLMFLYTWSQLPDIDPVISAARVGFSRA